MATQPLIEAQGLVRRYGSGSTAITALDGIDLQVRQGEFLAVTGPSGSGKSSLMSLLGLLDAPTAGVLRFRGKDIVRLHSDDRAVLRNRHIGFIFQSYHLLPRRSARGNVEMPLLYAGMSAPERRQRTAAALARVGLTERADAFPAELSGGEQQRVAIARALVGEPDLLLADEPTGALDSRTASMILTLLEGIRSEGRTLILVTHDHGVASRASRIVTIADGQIVGDVTNDGAA